MNILSRLQSWFNGFSSDPLGTLISFLTYALSILCALVLHEIAHGWVAFRCGDPTAKILGRLSLNPLKHLDPIGTLCMVVLGIGWAKPVPVNPRNFRNGRRDDFLVSIAGISTNLSLFIFSLLAFVLMYALTRQKFWLWYQPWFGYLSDFLRTFASINLSLGVFNLLPIPPLDGYHLLNDTLLRGRLQLNAKTFQIAQVILIVLCLTGALSNAMNSVMNAVWSSVLTLFLKLAGMQ